VQEGLTNTLRHSAASRVEVTYGVCGAALVLSVTDDGSPGSPERLTPTVGFGLRTLGERAAELGGVVRTAWSAAGLRVTAELPLATGRSRP
jgi:signal transduction histidine kinase